MSNLQDFIGKVFFRLTVLKLHSVKVNKQRRNLRFWLCLCECGKETVVGSSELKSGNTKSCGCLKREKFYGMITVHGKRNTLAYFSWASMIARCTNKKYHSFHRYGGRGITICKEWKESFAAFFNDMGDAPAKYYTLDRINNNLGYYKENCRWATKMQQSDNRNDTKHEEIDGIVMNQREITEYIGVSMYDFLKLKKIGFTSQQIKNLLKKRQE